MTAGQGDAQPAGRRQVRTDASASRREQSVELFTELVGLEQGSPRHAKVRAELVQLHAGLAYSIAHRFSRRGQPDDDLEQVAMMGLLKSVDRFDPARGLEFSTFATPTIRGRSGATSATRRGRCTSLGGCVSWPHRSRLRWRS